FIYKITQQILHVPTVHDLHLNLHHIFHYLIPLNHKVRPHYPSIYQHLIKHNPTTQIHYINPALTKLPKHNHIPTPLNHFLTNLLHPKQNQPPPQS
ncbi:ketopantoate reductase C-terminal domain-containing protein, partial [Staphylococcus epidermidis]|uniref:ketopantoate reductase C-terminal domain-containing protein n=1 Tax=Staphylococcus epidermidis TaxID=1282 RepID=UPI0028CB77D1